MTTTPATFDVFVSYRNADRVVVQRLVEALEVAGLNVWVDNTEIADLDSITQRILAGVSRSKVLLAWYSESYPESRACQWELTTAYLAAQRTGEDPRRRVLAINPESTNAHIHPIELRDAKSFAVRAPVTESQLAATAIAVRAHVTNVHDVLGHGQAMARTRWYGSVGTGSNRFVGRLGELWKIHTSLWSGEYAIITGTSSSSVTQVIGLGGVGKSLLAEEYALRFGPAYPGGVFWIRAFGNDTRRRQFSEEEQLATLFDQVHTIASSLGIPTSGISGPDVASALARWLDAAEKPFLWVVDDVANGLRFEELTRWFAPGRHGKTLLTTRSQEYAALGHALRVGTLPPDDAYDLLTNRRNARNQAEHDAANRIAERLGFHPLALDVTAAAMAYYASYAEFEEALAQPAEDALELAKEYAGVLPNGHETSIAATLLASVNRLGPEGHDFVSVAAVLSVAPISLDLLSMTFAKADGLKVVQGRARARSAFSQLDKLSLAEQVGTDSPARVVHGLVSRVVKRSSDERHSDRLMQLQFGAVDALLDILPAAADIRNHKAIEAEIGHARELVTDTRDLRTARLLGWVARYDSERGSERHAAEAYSKQLAVMKRLLGVEHRDTLNSMSNLSLSLYQMGDLARARTLQEEVLTERRRLLGPGHADVLNSMVNLSAILCGQGELAAARALQEDSVALANELRGPEHRDTLGAMDNLAQTLFRLGDFPGARRLQEQVLADRKRLLGAAHPDTLIAMNNLAGTLFAQGDLLRAGGLLEEGVTLARQVFGSEHPHTLTTMSSLAVTLMGRGDVAAARALEEEVLDVRRRLLGPEHPATLTSMNNLAQALGAQGDLKAARALLENGVALHSRSLGSEHPATLMMMNNLAQTLSAQWDLPGARALLEHVLLVQTRVIGPEHPDRLATVSNLALTLVAQGDLAAARAMQEEALALSRQLFGSEHTHTLTVMNNLAQTLLAQGNAAGSRALLVEAVTLALRYLGPDHGCTLTSVNNLAQVLSAQGDLAEARALLDEGLARAKRVFGPEHPQTLIVMHNLAQARYHQGDLRGARALHEETLSLRERVLGSDHPDTLISTMDLALILAAQGDLAGAQALQQKGVELAKRLHGPEHTRTLSSMNNLAQTYYEKGELDVARALHEEIRTKRIQLVGPEHPDTLTSTNNLALTLHAQGEFTAARELFENAVESARRLFGTEHPLTLTCMNNLAQTLSASGDLAGARDLFETTLAGRKQLLGREHPDTSVVAWNLLNTLSSLNEPARANELVTSELAWLLERTPEQLDRRQRLIRDWIAQSIGRS